MELIQHLCERDISNRTSSKNISLENLASNQKTFRIVKERSGREAPRDQSSPGSSHGLESSRVSAWQAA